MLACFQDTRIRLRAEGKPVGPIDTSSEEELDRFRDLPRITLAVFAEDDRIVLGGLRDADDAYALPAVEDNTVLGRRQSASRLV